MSTFASFARRATSGLVAAQILLGAVSVSSLALAAPVRAADASPVFGPVSTAPQPAPAPVASTQPPAAQPAAPQPSPIVAQQPPAAQPAAPQAPAPQAPAPQAPAPQAPAQAAAPQDITYLAAHGAWQGFSTVVDGETVVGATTRMDDGGVAAFMADKAGNLEILLADPAWRLREGMTVPVRIMIDGQGYTFTAIAHGNRLDIPRVTEAVLKSFVGGTQAQIDVGNGAVVWTLALDGFYDAAKDAARVIGA